MKSDMKFLIEHAALGTGGIYASRFEFFLNDLLPRVKRVEKSLKTGLFPVSMYSLFCFAN